MTKGQHTELEAARRDAEAAHEHLMKAYAAMRRAYIISTHPHIDREALQRELNEGYPSDLEVVIHGHKRK